MKDSILILTPGFPVDEADTTCLPLVQTFIRALQEVFPELNIVIVSLDHPYRKEYQWHGLPVSAFGRKRRDPFSKWLQHHRINNKLDQIVKEKKPIGILGFWYSKWTLVGKRVAEKYNLRHHCWILGQDAKKGNKYVKYIRPQANELIALSDFIADEFEKNYDIRPAHIIPPGIDPGSFTKHDTEKDIDILAAGSLITLKQYPVFIQVIAALKKQLPDIRAILAGKGPEKEKLQSLIIKQGLQNNITLTGELPHPELLKLMQRAKVFLHPSSYEGFGVVCIEALYAKASVISFCKPMKEKIKNWHIVNSEEEMTARAVQLLKNPVAEPVSPFLIKDTAISIMRLYGLHPSPRF